MYVKLVRPKEAEDGGAVHLGGGGEGRPRLVRGLRLQDPQRGHGTLQLVVFYFWISKLSSKGDVLSGGNCEAPRGRQCLSLDPHLPCPCLPIHYCCGRLCHGLCLWFCQYHSLHLDVVIDFEFVIVIFVYKKKKCAFYTDQVRPQLSDCTWWKSWVSWRNHFSIFALGYELSTIHIFSTYHEVSNFHKS